MKHTDSLPEERPFVLSSQQKIILITGVTIGLISLALGLSFDSTRTWINILLNIFFLLCLGLGGCFYLSLQGVLKASWITPFKKITEGLSLTVPITSLLLLTLILGIHSLYEWSHLEIVQKDSLLLEKAPYLNESFFSMRLILLAIIWSVFSFLLQFFSKKLSSSESSVSSYGVVSAIFLVLFALTFSVASFDLIMSLEPHWFSTIFAIYCFAGLFVSTTAIIVLFVIFLQSKGSLSYFSKDHYHDLGKILFGFSTFWAYIWFCQFILIWYSNIPEETLYYYIRWKEGWSFLFFLNLFLNWVIPFVLLLPRFSKRSPKILMVAAVILLIGRWFDLYLMVAPNVLKHHGHPSPAIGWIEIGIWLGALSLISFLVLFFISKKSLVPKEDPFFQEALSLHQ